MFQYIKRFSLILNTILLGFMLLSIGMHIRYNVTYMIYHSIPTIAAYIFFYYLIFKDKLDIYVWLLYATITIYMVAATICLGYNYGFHLYSSSLVPLAFYMDYLAHKLHTRKTHAIPVSIIVVCAYLFAVRYAIAHGPVYVINTQAADICLVMNSIAVFCLLIGYSYLMHKITIDSESKLSDMAHTDQLTGLFNRHYTSTYLNVLQEEITTDHWVAIVDIDDFKYINDHYGHNCGDYVLVELGKILQERCKGCVVSRWGGEEFLIIATGEKQDIQILESVRQDIESHLFHYQDKNVSVTATVGTAYYEEGQPLDRWIQNADNKLYQGKQTGKNRVIY